MRIEYRKQIDSDTAPWLSLTNVDELQWNGVYSLRVSNDDGSHNLPFRLRDDETVTFVVKDHSHPGKLQGSRTIVQEITHVDHATGSVSNYSRHCSNANGMPTWSKWTSDEKNVITWNQESHIDTFTTAGIYNIVGERTNSDDGLPFANSNPGHTFHARLVVLDSSMNGTEVCITQILMLSNRVNGDGNVYLRTGNAASKEELQSGNSWDLWGTLQQNIEVGQTTSLDDYIDKGIYSGVYMVSPTQLETFVLVVINNYALAASMGEERNISQFKYALNIDGNFSYKTRTGRGEDEMDWGSWVDLGAASTTDIQDGAITAQKLSTDVREKVENPLRPLYIAAGAEYNDTDSVIEVNFVYDRDLGGTKVQHLPYHYRLNSIGDITEDEMLNIYVLGKFNKGDVSPLGNANVRTNLGRTGMANANSVDTKNLAYYAECQTINLCTKESYEGTFPIKSGDSFYGASNLRAIYGRLVFDAYYWNMFKDCVALERFKTDNLKVNVSLKDSPLISKQTLLYMTQKASPTTAITITLHPDAYARLKDDAEIIAALEAQPLILLVSA